MKKKIINGILLVALVFATSSAFVSCKDNDEDLRIELQDQINKLRNEISTVTGPQGPQGPQGEQGPQREPGKSYTADEIKALLADELAAIEENAKNGATEAATAAALAALQEKIDAIKNDVKGIVSSLTAEGTYNPVFGAIAAPVDVTSNILAAYYGEGEAMSFHGQRITEFYNKDAGTIYVTVNPSEAAINADGFTLVNSRNEAAKVTLKAAESDKLLTWGWNQTRNASGLYAADVTVDDLDAVKFDYNEIASDLKTAIKKRTKSSMAELVSDVYSTVAGNQFPRLALKYSSTSDFFGTWTTRTGYDFGIIAIKPLSYDFDVNISKIPGLNRIEREINKIFNKITFDFGIDFSKFKDVTINLDRGGKDYIITVNVAVPVNQVVTVNIPDVNVPGQTIPVTLSYVDDGGVSHPVTGNVNVPGQAVQIPATAVALNFTINTTADANINEVVDDLFNSLNGDLAEINDMLNEVSKLANFETEIENTKANVKSQIFSYLDKFNNKFVNLVSKTNSALQPTLLIKTGNTLVRGGSIPAGEITLMPTSYTAEIVAPALKKFVKVECDGQEITGENLGKVIDGSICEIPVKIEAGKTYKITYDAVDFFGKVRSNTYNIIGK